MLLDFYVSVIEIEFQYYNMCNKCKPIQEKKKLIIRVYKSGSTSVGAFTCPYGVILLSLSVWGKSNLNRIVLLSRLENVHLQ